MESVTAGLALTCVNCRHVWANLSWDEYLDRAPNWDLISGTGYYLQSFCPTCAAVVGKCPEAMTEPFGHKLLQDEGGVRCECGRIYSPFRTNLLKGVDVDWQTVNRERLRHHAVVIMEQADSSV